MSACVPARFVSLTRRMFACLFILLELLAKVILS